MKKIIYSMLALILVLTFIIPCTCSAFATGYYEDYDYAEEYKYSDKSDYSEDYDSYYEDDYDSYYEDEIEYAQDSDESFSIGKSLLTAVVIGLVIALIVTLVMASQLNNVHKQESANTYIRAGSMNVTESQDLYLYRNIIRTAKPKNNGKK